MSATKDSLRLSLGLIQQNSGNNYLLTLLTKLILKIFLHGQEGNLWTRNSYEFNAHIPLLSDLDLTLFSGSSEVAQELNQKRSRFLVIGEINFYHETIRQELIQLANPYELKRDPQLIKKTKLSLTPTRAQLVIFMLRQLSSDQKWLNFAPRIRIQKWHYLCDIMDIEKQTIPSTEKLLVSLSVPEIMNDALNYLHQAPFHNIFEHSHSASWKYLSPQSHIWDLSIDFSYIEQLNDFQKEIMLEQIKWEFWGVGCHYYWLSADVATLHLERLLELAPYLEVSSSDKAAMMKIIDFIKQEASQAKQQNPR